MAIDPSSSSPQSNKWGNVHFLSDGALLLQSSGGGLHYFPSTTLRPLIVQKTSNPRKFTLDELTEHCPRHIRLEIPAYFRDFMAQATLTPSITTRLVAAHTPEQVAILALPTLEDLPSTSVHAVKADILEVGEEASKSAPLIRLTGAFGDCHEGENPHKVTRPPKSSFYLQVEWHPLSQGGSHLCILSTDGYLR